MLLLLFCFVAFAVAQNVTMTDDDVVEALEDACCDAIQKILHDRYVSPNNHLALYMKLQKTNQCCETLNWYFDAPRKSSNSSASEFAADFSMMMVFIFVGLFAFAASNQRR
jgi:hypothetical protein